MSGVGMPRGDKSGLDAPPQPVKEATAKIIPNIGDIDLLMMAS